MVEAIATLSGVLLVLSAAVLVRTVAVRRDEVAYPILLVLVGVAVSILGLDPSLRLSSEVVLVLLVPTILF